MRVDILFSGRMQRRLQRLSHSSVGRLIANPPFLAASDVVLELRPLRSPGVTRLHHYYEPLRHPTRPSLSLTRFSLTATRRHRRGFPCCVDLLCQHAVAITPVRPRRICCSSSPDKVRGTLLHDVGLPHYSGGSALTLPFSRPARRSLTLRPVDSRSRQSDPFHRRLRQLRYLHRRSDYYRLEQQVAGRD